MSGALLPAAPVHVRRTRPTRDSFLRRKGKLDGVRACGFVVRVSESVCAVCFRCEVSFEFGGGVVLFGLDLNLVGVLKNGRFVGV